MVRFKHVFIAITVSTALLVAAFILHRQRPVGDIERATAEHVQAVGKCASCHREETSAVVHEYETSVHARQGVTCLDCHQPASGQKEQNHKGFVITAAMTAKNCAACHATEYDQFARSRHGPPSWAAVAGREGFTEAQLQEAMRYHPQAVDRPANVLARLEGRSAIVKGCNGCHAIGKPNEDGSFGSCTACHSRHRASIALARSPSTCGQCHMGPDHAQLEIYQESKHGVLFSAHRDEMNLDADPKALTARDMPTPTCSTCHMSGLEGMKVTHDTTERLSWYLFAPVSEERANYDRNQREMKELCRKCHAEGHVERFYEEAERVLADTNDRVRAIEKMMSSLDEEGLLTDEPFDEPIDFVAFDYWHYYGRTAKHGAFMGGADFVQWHGNYELLKVRAELEEMAAEKRAHARENGRGDDDATPGHGGED